MYKFSVNNQLLFTSQPCSSSLINLIGMSNEVNPFSPAPAPATALGRYRMLSARAGVRVSPLCLGGASIGDEWAKIGMGAMDKESSFKLLDAFYDAGGNFIDTANN